MELLESYERDTEILKEQIIDIANFMKGGLTFNEAWGECYVDRELMVKRISKHLKEESGSTKEYL